MKAAVKFESSSMVSNLLLACAVLAAATPLLLGDQLVVIVSNAMTEGSYFLQSIGLSLQRLLG
jgi:hypothetical protein